MEPAYYAEELKAFVAQLEYGGHMEPAYTVLNHAECIAERVVLLRGRRRWTQGELAAQADVSVDTVRRVEHGLADRMAGRTLRAIARALGTTVEYLTTPIV